MAIILLHARLRALISITGGLFMAAPFLSGQVVLSNIGGSSYTENFDGLTEDGLPSGWSVHSNATASSLGSAATFATTPASWGATTGNFRNVAASTGQISSLSSEDQSPITDRALGVRQGGSFGDPGAAFVFRFNATGYTDISFSLDAMMLSVQSRSTTWSLQTSTDGASWTGVTTWSDPGSFGKSTLTSGVVASFTNASTAYVRFAALSASTGSGSRDTIAIDNFTLTYSAIASASPIPEPSTYGLIGGASVLLIGLMKRRSGGSRARPPSHG